jgi:hypothetical protein
MRAGHLSSFSSSQISSDAQWHGSQEDKAVDKKKYNSKDKLNVGNGAQAVLEFFTCIPNPQSSVTLKNAGHSLNN